MLQNPSVRVRYAPSPTGEPHIGNIRTALFNWLFARHWKGKFILRIEDTDRARVALGSLEKIIESLNWLGLDWDEGVTKVKNKLKSFGPHRPYVQSERLEIYRRYAEELLEKEKAYRCFCLSERLEKMRKEQLAQGRVPMYDGRCRELIKIKKSKNFVIRLKVPQKGKIEFKDLIHGKVEFESKNIDDQILLKSDGWPTYHLASVIDDHLMKITHVIRGEEWLSSTPKHLLLYQAFGWQPPQFAHLPIILGLDRSKLSKRRGAISILEYKEQGYLPETLINFMVLLGWSPKIDRIKGKKEKEIFSREELIKKFSLDDVQKSSAVFNAEKLNWMNGYYIRQLNLEELTKKCLPYLQDKYFPDKVLIRSSVPIYKYVKKIVVLEQERIKKLSEIVELTDFFFAEKLNYDPSLLKWKKMTREEIVGNLDLALKKLVRLKEKEFKERKIKEILMKIAEKVGTGELLWPFRVALTGRETSPGPFEIAEVLGKEKVIKRVKEAIKLIERIAY